jgi:hypothetical protein
VLLHHVVANEKQSTQACFFGKVVACFFAKVVALDHKAFEQIVKKHSLAAFIHQN